MEDTKVYVTVSLDKSDENRLDQLCDGLGKTRDEVVSIALYFLEQSLLYDPVCLEGMDMEGD